MEPISDFWFYKFISPTTKFSTPLSDFHVKSMCAPTALTRGVREASSIPSFQSMTHQSLLPCSHDRALLGSRGWTERPRNPSDILLEFFIGPSFHKAICKTSKMIAANHCNTEYVQHSSTESTTRDHVDKGLDGSAFLCDVFTFGFDDFSDVGCSLDLDAFFSLWTCLLSASDACLGRLFGWNTHTHTPTKLLTRWQIPMLFCVMPSVPHSCVLCSFELY